MYHFKYSVLQLFEEVLISYTDMSPIVVNYVSIGQTEFGGDAKWIFPSIPCEWSFQVFYTRNPIHIDTNCVSPPVAFFSRYFDHPV